MDYKDSRNVEKLNKFIWGDDSLYVRTSSYGRFKPIRGLIIQRVERQAIPSIERATIKIPGVDGVRMTGRPSLGSTEINVECTIFDTNRARALDYRNYLMKTFYVDSEGDKLEVRFPDTGNTEYVWLVGIELLRVTKSGAATFNLKFENPTGLSHRERSKNLRNRDMVYVNSLVPIRPSIDIIEIIDINKAIQLEVVDNTTGASGAIRIPNMKAICEKYNVSTTDTEAFGYLKIDVDEQSVIWYPDRLPSRDITADILGQPGYRLDFASFQFTEAMMIVFENIKDNGAFIKYTEYNL